MVEIDIDPNILILIIVGGFLGISSILVGVIANSSKKRKKDYDQFYEDHEYGWVRHNKLIK